MAFCPARAVGRCRSASSIASSNCAVRTASAAAAQATRRDSLRWARYGFGDADGALAREQAQIAALIGLDNP